MKHKLMKNNPQNQLPSYWRIPAEREGEVLETTNTFLMNHGIFLQDIAEYLRRVVLIQVAENRYLFEHTPVGMCQQLDLFCDDLLKLSNLIPSDIQHLASNEELRKVLVKDEARLKNRIIELESQVFELTTGKKLNLDEESQKK